MLWGPGHGTQGEERDPMPFSSEIAACPVPDDSSTTAGFLSHPFALPALGGGNQDAEQHRSPVNATGRPSWLVFVSRGESRGLAFRLGVKQGQTMGLGRSHYPL